MLKPSTERNMNSSGSYAFVVGIAKRAREIAVEFTESEEIFIRKPLSVAVEEFENDELEIDTINK